MQPAKIGRDSAAAHGIESVENLGVLKGRKFDFVLCRHVLEHVDYPLGCLLELRDYVAKLGRLIVVVPVEPVYQPPDPNDLNHHLHCWNPQTLHNLMLRAVYTVVDWPYEYYEARRKLLPIYRRFGGNANARWVRIVGRVFRFRELVIVGEAPSGHNSF